MPPVPINPVPWEHLPDPVQERAAAAVETALTEITGALYNAPPTARDAAGAPPARQLDYRLARLAAGEIITEHLANAAEEHAFAAGRIEGSPASYSDLGRAVGMTREGARSRFPGAVPDAKPGRPKKLVQVTFRGGPEQWDGYEMEYAATALEGELDGVGAYLVVDAVPEGVPADSRAHYAPVSEDDRATWTFQGWVPSWT